MSGPTADRAHLSIGEVLSLLQEEFPDVTISKIRFLESQGLLDPERTPSGYRKFYEEDIGRLRWILTQQKEHFLPLKVIKDRMVELSALPGGIEEHGLASGSASALHENKAGVEAIQDRGLDAGSPPIWMADAARAAVARAQDDGPTAAAGSPIGASPAIDRGRDRMSMLEPEGPSVQLTLAELASASGLEAARLRELEAFGLVEGNGDGSDTRYDSEALVIAQRAAEFLSHGIEARHLRMFKISADREAGFLEQVVMPAMKQRDPAARERAVDTLGELAALGESMRAALLRRALRDHLSG